ncbi:MAG: hypothetical protein Q4F49_03705 [Pseudoxanthomonas suwonensis]|nr:hypothetical protein [Pseudoxanthomonas suwonensis]
MPPLLPSIVARVLATGLLALTILAACAAVDPVIQVPCLTVSRGNVRAPDAVCRLRLEQLEGPTTAIFDGDLRPSRHPCRIEMVLRLDAGQVRVRVLDGDAPVELLVRAGRPSTAGIVHRPRDGNRPLRLQLLPAAAAHGLEAHVALRQHAPE